MDTDLLLWIDGISGDSHIKGFEDWIEVVSFEHAIQQTGRFGSTWSSRASAERSDHQPLIITKKIDTVTPTLAQACCRGTPFREIKLNVNSTNTRNHVTILEIRLKHVMICSVRLH